MTKTSETLVKILETVMQSQERLVDVLSRMEQGQQEQTHALVELLDRIEARAEAIDARIAADNRALAELLKHIADTTSRTEQMTAQILTEISSKGASH